MKMLSVEGLAIAGLSVTISLLTLPLYHAADALQKQEREQRKALAPDIERIKAVFTGDERYMMLSTLYRQNHYHPIYALRNSLNLLIQVPFFVAAYHFLSHLQGLHGVSFLFIQDLGTPDAVLSFRSLRINILPILMTSINLLSGAIYSRGFPKRDKVQIYGVALIFLVLLYNSPAGLVFYWTLNNLFSLGKNLFSRLPHPLRKFYGLSVTVSVLVSVYVISMSKTISTKKIIFLVLLCSLIILIPFILKILRYVYIRYSRGLESSNHWNTRLFIISGIVLWMVHGLLLPSNLIATSVQEFATLDHLMNPLVFIIYTMTVFAGIFLLWPILLYKLSGKAIRTGASLVFPVLAVTSILNLFVFAGDYGIITQLLIFENPALLESPNLQSVIALCVSLLVFIIFFFLMVQGGKRILGHIIVLTLASGVIATGWNFWQIESEYKELQTILTAFDEEKTSDGKIDPIIHLSREGKNVIVLMLDRAISSYLPIVMEVIPELNDQFSGFTYFPNTVSLGQGTIMGSPALMGGYEYTPIEMNARADEALVDKHNEAMLLLPRIFSDAGYSVLVTDPPLSNYAWSGDFRPFEPYPDIDVRVENGRYNVRYTQEHQDDFSKIEDAGTLIRQRLPLFALMMSAFPFMREDMYDDGYYYSAKGMSFNFDEFLASYAQLYYLSEMTSYDGEKNAYVFIDNETTHEPVNLRFPEFSPTSYLDEIYNPFEGVQGVDERDIKHFHVNVAALKRIGIWLENLKKHGVYDNTRIIIVADHGKDVFVPPFKDYSEHSRTFGDYNPLLLYKDFSEQSSFTVDYQFMTNADTPLLALRDLDIETINPFTGKDLLNQVDKDSVEVIRGPWAPPRSGNQNQFEIDYSKSFRVKDDIFEESNWEAINPVEGM
ncbi:MAG: YidC/Oxa1 family membrane protein insertase [Sphaerochaetaceae bacterium]|nr:YidC/Oxa1 family membrane protein insertase [Sphaerochaetaceae bacterium]